MRTDFVTMRVGEIASSISDTHKRDKEKLVFLNTSDVLHGKFLHATYSSVRDWPGQAKKSIRKDDILFSEIRPANGRWAFVDRDADDYVVSTKLMVIRTRSEVVLPRYLYLFLTSEATTNWLQHLAESRSGTFPQITFDQVATLDIGVPSIATQRAIVHAVGSLDEKIESNRRAISLLDDLARSRFRSWRSSTEATEMSTFGDFADVFGGSTPKTGEASYWGGGLAWATPTDLTALRDPYLFSTSRTISRAGLDSCATELHPPGSILMTSRATIGEFAVNQIPCSTNQGFIVVRPREGTHRWFLFEEMRSRIDEMLAHSNGSTFRELSRGNFKNLGLAVPEPRRLVELDEMIAPLHAKATQLSRENARLARLRVVLLPELLTGRVYSTQQGCQVGVAC